MALSRKATAPQNLVLRAKIVLLAADGLPGIAIAMALNVGVNAVSKWCARWREWPDEDATEQAVTVRLSDLPRPGTPPKSSAKQLTSIIALACQKPETFGRPIEQWTHRELRDELLKQGIVEEISIRHVGRILEESALQPHRVRYWLTGRPDPNKEEKIDDICKTYTAAKNSPNEAFLSVDEKTGIQALERKAIDKPMRPGKPRAVEFEYTRHGTSCLLGAFNVATGKIFGYCNPTRTEADFLNFIDQCLDELPNRTKYHFILDNLNTHKSESLVCYVAEMEGDLEKLGEKGKSGLLKNTKTREAYLRNPSHFIVFHYTPKHASWINQIEAWFGILVKKALRWASFESVAKLNQRILAFIDYFNRTMAKPFEWRYSGPSKEQEAAQ